MNTKRGYLLLTALTIAALVILAGCKKKPAPAAPATPTKTAAPAKSPSMKDMTNKATTAAADANKAATAVTAAVEQTMCPVMDGNKIDKNVFVEYQGKKVYFCCAQCKAAFEKEPEKYLANLPQFAK